jgi:hypothetical protein
MHRVTMAANNPWVSPMWRPGIAVDETAGRFYVVNNRWNTLSILDEAARAVVDTRRIPRERLEHHVGSWGWLGCSRRGGPAP